MAGRAQKPSIKKSDHAGDEVDFDHDESQQNLRINSSSIKGAIVRVRKTHEAAVTRIGPHPLGALVQAFAADAARYVEQYPGDPYGAECLAEAVQFGLDTAPVSA